MWSAVEENGLVCTVLMLRQDVQSSVSSAVEENGLACTVQMLRDHGAEGQL